MVSRRAEVRSARVLVISLSDLTLDGRVQRQLAYLVSGGYEVVIAAVSPPPERADVKFVGLEPLAGGRVRRHTETGARVGLRVAGRYEEAYWRDARVRVWRDVLASLDPVDVILVNDLWAVPLAFAIGRGAAVIFDSHEHWTSESASWTRWQRSSMRGAHEWIVDQYVPRTTAMMTVSPGIARAYEARIGICPTLVTNAPFYEDLSPSPVGSPIRCVHVGYADERRRLEDTIEVVRSLAPRFSLDMFLVRDNAYRRRLQDMAAGEEGIRILPPVARADLVRVSNQYDVGVFLLPDRFPNQVFVLPNKLFDYIQARLAVAIGPSPEMASIVRDWDCGVVSESFAPESFADALSALTADAVERMKRNSDRAAAVLNADQNRNTLLALISEAIESGRRPAATRG